MTLDDIERLHQAGDIQAAKQGYLDFIHRHKGAAKAMHLLALLYAEEGDMAHAIQYMGEAHRQQPDDPVLTVHLANMHKNSGDYEQAENLLLSVIKTHPRLAAAYNNLGTLYFTEKKWQQAIEAFYAALDIQANYIDAYYNLGLALNKADKTVLAQNAFQSVLELSNAHPGAHFQLGCFVMQQGHYEEAVQHFNVIAKIYPHHYETQFNLATCYLKLGKLNEAKRHYLCALEINPSDGMLSFNLGVVSMQLGQIDPAIEFYLRALKAQPDYYEAHNNISIAYLAKRDINAALRHFREVLRILPHNEAVEHTINILSREKSITSSPPEYIQSLFDSYADHYDNHLKQALHYRVPAFIQAVMKKHYPAANHELNVLDIGCGTGLTGEILRPYAKQLVGVDLSEKMLAIAAQKKIYDQLAQADILAFFAGQAMLFDVIVAGDVVVYFGELTALFAAAAKQLAVNGLFIFNTEISEAENYYMNESGRFAHAQTYIQALSEAHHLSIVSCEFVLMRTQNNVDVNGYLYVLKKASV